MPRITESDAYKFSMGEAGAALRVEDFYHSHRRGGLNGWHFMPVDVSQYVNSCLPVPDEVGYGFLRDNQYDVGAAYRKAFWQLDEVKVTGVPKGSWFYSREPAFSVRGPSAVASWLEPHSIKLNFRIQVATTIKSGKMDDPRFQFATCEEERDIILETFDSLGFQPPKIEVRMEEYVESVFKRAQRLVQLVKNPDRIFEVGMRAVSCQAQHKLALEAIKRAGILRTSNAHLAQLLGMIPVGTMGHEHVQRYGDDYEAFVAMRDRFPGFLFYLPDTFNTLRSGIPSALRVIAEQPKRDAGIRFDSEHGIRGHYTFTVARAMEMGLQPRLALESGWNYELTEEFEHLREMVKWPEDRQAYGYGGYLVKPEWPSFLRDDVSAVWKISQSGSRAIMKFGDEPGGAKESIPGRPVIWRTNPLTSQEDAPVSYIAQEGEGCPFPDCTLLTGAQESSNRLDPSWSFKARRPPVMSPETTALIHKCREDREEVISRAAMRGL